MSDRPYRDAAAAMERLLSIMAELRTPNTGCPWDLEQDFASIAPYTIEEAYEVADAIERGDLGHLRSELGDLLFQVVFHARMAEETGAFAFKEVAEAISEKMLARHPHVFGDAHIADADAQIRAWEDYKAAERAARGKEDPSALADVPKALPALMRAEKLAKRAARVGFDWPDPDRVIEKLHEELEEIRTARAGGSASEIHEEVGDLLFVVANLARKLNVDPEVALRDANAKFERRFRGVEARLAEDGLTTRDASLDDMEAHWNSVKASEKA